MLKISGRKSIQLANMVHRWSSFVYDFVVWHVKLCLLRAKIVTNITHSIFFPLWLKVVCGVCDATFEHFYTRCCFFLSFLERANVRVRKRSCWKVFMFLVLLQANRLRQIDVHIYRTHSLSYVCSRALFSVTTVKLDLNLCSDLNLNSRESIIQSRILCRTIHICTIWMKNPILFGMRAKRTS